MIIVKQDSNGVKPLLQVGELGYDNFPAGGDEGRVWVGTGTSNIAQAKKSEVMAVQDALDLKANADNAELTGIPTAPTATVGTDTTQLATTAFVKAEVASEAYSKAELNAGQLDSRYYIKGSVDILYSTVVKLTGDQTIEDVKTFMSSPIVPTPTAVNQAVNKQYVDNMVISPNGSNSYAVAMAIVFGS